MSARAGIIELREAMKELIEQGWFGALINKSFLVFHPAKGVKRLVPVGQDAEAADQWIAARMELAKEG